MPCACSSGGGGLPRLLVGAGLERPVDRRQALDDVVVELERVALARSSRARRAVVAARGAIMRPPPAARPGRGGRRRRRAPRRGPPPSRRPSRVAVGAERERLGAHPLLLEAREDDDAEARVVRAQLGERLQPVDARHREVEQHDVGLRVADGGGQAPPSSASPTMSTSPPHSRNARSRSRSSGASSQRKTRMRSAARGAARASSASTRSRARRARTRGPGRARSRARRAVRAHCRPRSPRRRPPRPSEWARPRTASTMRRACGWMSIARRSGGRA